MTTIQTPPGPDLPAAGVRKDPGGENHRPHILVVDDEQIMRDFLADVLRDEGYEVATVTSGGEGLARIQKIHCDLVLTDIKMPGMDGMELLRRVKEIDPSVEVIVMTGYASVGSAVESMKVGASDYLTKPLNIDQIRIVVAKTLERKRLCQQAEEREFYKELSQADGLTGLYNHRTFHELLDSEFSRSQRYARPLSLLMLDIDNFKVFNDHNGHPSGDITLKEVAWILRKKTRRCDFVCRYGGEEFAVIVPETEKAEAGYLAQRLRMTVEETEFEGAEVMPHGRLTISIGLATFPTDARTKEELVEKADRALYRAKSSGRNQLCMCEAAEVKPGDAPPAGKASPQER